MGAALHYSLQNPTKIMLLRTIVRGGSYHKDECTQGLSSNSTQDVPCQHPYLSPLSPHTCIGNTGTIPNAKAL